MSLTIALCHDALIPPVDYGGTERILAYLAQGLQELGHTVVLVAKEGSRLPGVEVVPTRPGKSFEELAPPSVDVLHLWGTPAAAPKRPSLVTIEGNGKPGETFISNTVFVSRKHAENHGSRHYVYNGIDPAPFKSATERTGRWVFLAKASWAVKNLEGAIAIARAADVELEVLGSRNWPFNLQRKLARIGGVRYWGMVNEEEKRTILAHSDGLFFPVRWHEPFGIAVIEALASGCPVYASPYGSLPELVTPAVGWVSADSQSWVRELKAGTQWDREACRARVREKFSHLTMARDYLRHYEAILATGRLAGAVEGEPAPRTRAGFEAQALLPWHFPDPPAE